MTNFSFWLVSKATILYIVKYDKGTKLCLSGNCGHGKKLHWIKKFLY
jgi:hypothetical protein